MKTPARRRSAPAGFTLIEIMLVVGIIVILMGAVLTRVGGFTDSAKITATEAKINTLVAGLRTYQNNNGGILPSTEQGLRALVEKPGGRPEPRRWIKMADADSLLDSWGTQMTYVTPAKSGDDEFEVISAGPDKKMNTADDISSAKGN